ncbi:MAG TPA: GNAT family N-acetyltransferase [Devosiaceae bacterium]|jgi:GNAT superfamily N-acetyltransferase|nr:GNAT family N-acetyltransferase [Devosiaceae bacterium]
MGRSIFDAQPGAAEQTLALRPPRSHEAAALTALCLRSKAAWGYDGAFMRACRGELLVTAEVIATELVMVADRAGEVVGLAQLSLAGEEAELVKLFVDPLHLRSGAGRRLFDWSVEAARSAGARRIVVDSDPHAAGFYRRMGMMDDGAVPSGSVPGRLLPRLRLAL